MVETESEKGIKGRVADFRETLGQLAELGSWKANRERKGIGKFEEQDGIGERKCWGAPGFHECICYIDVASRSGRQHTYMSVTVAQRAAASHFNVESSAQQKLKKNQFNPHSQIFRQFYKTRI